MGNIFGNGIAAFLTGNNRLLQYFTVISLLIAASVFDVREYRIPNNLVRAGAAIGLFFSLFDTEGGFVGSIIGGTAAVIVLLLIHYITKGGLGLGDVKLFGCVGIYLGVSRTFTAIITAAIISGLFSLVLIFLNHDNRKREIPFAPFILVGTFSAIIF